MQSKENDIDLSKINIYELNSSICRDSFYEFCLEFWQEFEPKNIVFNWHIKYLCDVLDRAGKKLANNEPKEKDILINCPPGFSKSSIVSILFPAWVWALNPSLKILGASSTIDVAKIPSLKSKAVITSDKYQKFFPHVRMKPDQANKLDFHTTANGEKLVIGKGTSVTSRHFDLRLYDDVLDKTKINSDTERDEVNEFVDYLSTRTTDTNSALSILVMQRLHVFDVSRYWIDSKRDSILHICLPAELNSSVSPKSLVEFYHKNNGLLDPVRGSREILAKKLSEMGSERDYKAQFLQTPVDPTQEEVSDKWFKIISEAQFEEAKRGKGAIVDFWIDSAFTTNTKRNDPTVILATTKINNDLYITCVSEKWLAFTDLVDHVQKFTRDNGYSGRSRIWIEPKANGISLSQTLKKHTGLNVVYTPSPNQVGKSERFTAITPALQAGRVILVQGSWNKIFLEQVCYSSRHDDIRDVLSYSVEEYINKKTTYGKYAVR